MNKLHATGARALGVRANDLNRQIARNNKDNELFTRDLKKYYKILKMATDKTRALNSL